MTIRSTILNVLKGRRPICDDCISEATGVTPRQSINANCRGMAEMGEIERVHAACGRCQRTKIVNRLLPESMIGAMMKSTEMPRVAAVKAESLPWYWEGHVQKRIVEFLRAKGCVVHSEADTLSRIQGKDIVAQTATGQRLWVTVKGFPEKSRNTQARHWFAGALLDLARYRDEDKEALLAIGLPKGFATYETLLRKTSAVRQFLGYRVYWVEADGAITEDPCLDDCLPGG